MKGKSIDLKFIVTVMTKHLVLIIVAAVLGGILGYVFVSQTTSTTYTARVELVAAVEREFFENDEDIKDDESSKSNLQGVSNTVNSQRLISTFMYILKTNGAADVVVEEIKANDGYFDEAPKAPEGAEEVNISKDWITWINSGTVRNSLTFSAVEDTNIFVANITTNNYYLTYAICRAFEETAPKAIEKLYYNVGAVECFESSLPYETPVNVVIPTVIGAVAGALIVAAIFVLLSYLDDTIKFESDLLQFQVLFLGGVPEINPNDKNELGKYSYNYGYGYGYGYSERKPKKSEKKDNV